MKRGYPCEYCKLIHDSYIKATTKKQRQHAVARLKLHQKQVHTNPPSKRRIKMARVAFKLGYRLYKLFKHTGVPKSVISRVPDSIRPYVIEVLKANDVPILNPSRKSRFSDAQLAALLTMIKAGLSE